MYQTVKNERKEMLDSEDINTLDCLEVGPVCLSINL